MGAKTMRQLRSEEDNRNLLKLWIEEGDKLTRKLCREELSELKAIIDEDGGWYSIKEVLYDEGYNNVSSLRQSKIKLLDRAILKGVALSSDILLYRGGEIPIKDFNVGATFKLPYFCSTSLNPMEAWARKDRDNSRFLEITNSVSNSKVAFLGGKPWNFNDFTIEKTKSIESLVVNKAEAISERWAEFEVLLPRDLEYKIINIEDVEIIFPPEYNEYPKPVQCIKLEIIK